MSHQTIKFGLHLDGQRAFSPANTLGQVVTGPLGLLGILETQLGLLAQHPSQAERIVQYRDCLSQADSDTRFYHQTFGADALGTASALLAWRDAWYLHGWDGDVSAHLPLRIRDIAEVEASARSSVGPSIGQRLAAVLLELAKRKTAIHVIHVVDPIDVFPKRWQDVLAHLPIVLAVEAVPAGTGFLGSLQRNLSLAASSNTFDKLAWIDDESVMVVQAETRFLAGAWISSQIEEESSSLLVATADAARLDEMLVSSNRPRQGLRESSAFRPTLQVLPLALEILWEPLNFFGLIQFLTHPVCPVPHYARRKLAEKVADKPGVRGGAWDSVLTDIDKHYGEEAAPAIREKIRFWIEHPRFSQDGGVPVAVILERVQALVDFFRARLADTDPSRKIAFNAGYSQCDGCAESLRSLMAQGVETIRPRQLQTLVTQATSNGTENSQLVAEVGAGLAVSHPGAAIEAVDTVLWWQLSMPTMPSAYPWSAAEIRALGEVGVVLPPMAEILRYTSLDWLRPILAVRKKLILVLPPHGEEIHPVWQMVEAVVKDPPIFQLEQFLTQPSPITGKVAFKPLPAPTRWWQLPADLTVPMRAQESFSSLELLLFNPYHWLLKYPARLRPSRVVSLSGDFRMLGNLAHGLVEALYSRTDALTMNDAEFDAWFATTFAQQVSEEGAVFLMAGQGSELEGFRFRLFKSVKSLRQQMAKAGATTVVAEMKLAGQFVGGELSGYADLVLKNVRGEHAIVDMKWSGAKKFPEKLKENRHLQLAIYAELLRQTTGTWPSVAYYILDRGRFFSPDTRAFPDAEAIPSKSGENTAQLWLRFVESWKWRKAQFDSGRIEVAIEGLDPTDDSKPPDRALESEYLNVAYNDYRSLAGWGF